MRLSDRRVSGVAGRGGFSEERRNARGVWYYNEDQTTPHKLEMKLK